MVKNLINHYLAVESPDISVQARGRLLNALLLVVGVADAATILTDILTRRARAETLTIELGALIAFYLLYRFTRKGHRWPPIAFLAFFSLATPYAFKEMVSTPLALAFALPVIVVPLIASSWLTLAVAAIEIIMMYGLTLALSHPMPDPLVTVILSVLGMIAWLSSWTMEVNAKDLGQQGMALSDRNQELQANRVLLEARTEELERRSAYLRTSSQVTRAAVTILETDQLVQEIVEIIRERFALYYVGLFLVDEKQEWAVLRGGTGPAGQAMLARGHKIRVGEGMIGKSISIKEARILQDTEEVSERHATPELPGTRSELALPLRSRDRVVGALTVQSDQVKAFDEESITTLQVMADQVAVALDNARLFVEAREALETTRRAYAQLSRDSWREYLRTRQYPGLARSKSGFAALDVQAASQAGEGRDGRHKMLPIRLRGEVIGEIELVKAEGGGEWTPEETLLLENLMEQLGATLESARLYQETQQRAAREQLVGSVTSRVRETLDIEMVLKTAVKEIRKALGVPEAVIRLAAPAVNADDNGAAAHEEEAVLP